MPFDLSEMDTLTLAEAGVPMPILNLRTRTPVVDDDGSAVTITFAGRQSETFREVLKAIQTRRGEAVNRLGVNIDAETKEREDIDILIACTLAWTIKTLDHQPFPCSPQNIRKLWNDPRFRPLREQAMGFLLNDANFLPQTSGVSDDTPVTSSLSVVPSRTAAAASETPSRISA
jgi:hypothetical protein